MNVDIFLKTRSHNLMKYNICSTPCWPANARGCTHSLHLNKVKSWSLVFLVTNYFLSSYYRIDHADLSDGMRTKTHA